MQPSITSTGPTQAAIRKRGSFFIGTDEADAGSTTTHLAIAESRPVAPPPRDIAPPATPTTNGANELCKIITFNVAGLIPYKEKGKLQLLAELAAVEKAAIILLTESHLSDHIRDAEIWIPNYVAFRTDRLSHRKKGGVITYIDERLARKTMILYSESNAYTEAQVLHLCAINMIVVNAYRPPECPNDKFMDQLTNINSIINALPTPTPSVLFSGDLNFPRIDWDSHTVYGGTSQMRAQADALLTLANEQFLTQIIRSPTRENNILDIVMTNNMDLPRDYSVNKTNLSDHNMIILDTNITLEANNRTLCIQRLSGFSSLNFRSNSVSWLDVKAALSRVCWGQMVNYQPKDQYNFLIGKCLEVSKKYVLEKRAPPKNDIPRDRKILMRRKLKLRKKRIKKF